MSRLTFDSSAFPYFYSYYEINCNLYTSEMFPGVNTLIFQLNRFKFLPSFVILNILFLFPFSICARNIDGLSHKSISKKSISKDRLINPPLIIIHAEMQPSTNIVFASFWLDFLHYWKKKLGQTSGVTLVAFCLGGLSVFIISRAGRR